MRPSSQTTARQLDLERQLPVRLAQANPLGDRGNAQPTSVAAMNARITAGLPERSSSSRPTDLSTRKRFSTAQRSR